MILVWYFYALTEQLFMLPFVKYVYRSVQSTLEHIEMIEAETESVNGDFFLGISNVCKNYIQPCLLMFKSFTMTCIFLIHIFFCFV